MTQTEQSGAVEKNFRKAMKKNEKSSK